MESLAVKYRPKRFEDVVEQEVVITILKQQVEKGTHRNCYLFCGGAGTGKTTVARIFASELNRGLGVPIEIDAASNNGVDNVREISEDAKFKALDAEYKVYIIDEAHQLSNSAWNAMLKLIEEPPVGTIFLFCTTDPQKIPATIMSRVQRFDFHRISEKGIVRNLEQIIKSENAQFEGVWQLNDVEADLKARKETHIEYTDKALISIARRADGGMRDAITLLDKCLAFSRTLDRDNVAKVLGFGTEVAMDQILKALHLNEPEVIIDTIETLYRDGVDLKQFMKQFVLHILEICKDRLKTKSQEVEEVSYSDLVYLLSVVNKLNGDMRWETSPKQRVEVELICLCQEWNASDLTNSQN